MNRVIKFRVWDKEIKGWYEPIYNATQGELYDVLIGVSGQVFFRDLNGLALPKDRYELMQFTGLLDRNGKEIYEGDKVNVFPEMFAPFVGQIGWNKDSACFAIQDGEDTWFYLTHSPIEVIGNLYENPDLLK